MDFSTSLCPHLNYAGHYFKLSSVCVPGRRKTLLVMTTSRRLSAPHGIRSVFGTRNFSINSNDVPEPARDLLQRLFEQTQKLEEQMNGNSYLDVNILSNFDLQNLESDLQAALDGLKKKEEDLLEAERIVKLENAELISAREELEQREKKIEIACSKQEKLEEKLRDANLKVVSQARCIEDLKLKLNQRDQEITLAKFEVSKKEDEIDKLKCSFMWKNDEADKANAEIESKSRILNEVHAVLRNQEIELQALHNDLRQKQLKLEELLVKQQFDDEKVKLAESKLEKQTMEWLMTQEELKKLGELTSKHIGERKETMEDFQRVKMLLVDVRSELVSSRQSLATSRGRMEERECLLEKQLLELDEQKEAVLSYTNNLKSAHIELESERAKLRVVEGRNKELELDLSFKRHLIQGLQEELYKDNISLEQAILELSSLREELDKKNKEFEETSNLLDVKEKDLVEARLEIQHLKSENLSLKLVLQERDSELITARERLNELNAEVAELRYLLNGKEEQLILSNGMLKEKEDLALEMQHELNHARVRATEAASVVERIVDLTKGLVFSIKEDDDLAAFGRPVKDYEWPKKQLEAELELTQGNLRAKETELLVAQRELAMKDNKLKTILKKLEEKDLELKELEETLNVYAQGGARENRVQELNFEKLQLEAAQREVEAATSSLQKLVEMSRDLLNTATTLCFDSDLDVRVSPSNKVSLVDNVFLGGNREYFTEVKSEVTRLSALTERLVQGTGSRT